MRIVRFSSGRNKLVQLLIRSRNSGGRTIWSLIISHSLQTCPKRIPLPPPVKTLIPSNNSAPNASWASKPMGRLCVLYCIDTCFIGAWYSDWTSAAGDVLWQREPVGHLWRLPGGLRQTGMEVKPTLVSWVWRSLQ